MFARFSSPPWLPWILVGAFLVRVLAAVVVQHEVEKTPSRICLIDGDAIGYWELAKCLAEGREYAIYDPPRKVHRMPGFPLVLAGGIKLFGTNLLPIRLLLALLGTIACGLVYWLTRDLVDHPTALIACFVAAVSPTFVVFSVLLLSETVFAVFLLASLIALSRLAQCHSQSPATTTANWALTAALVAGLLAGIATLVRPTWLLVGPAFAAVYLFAPGNRRRRVAPAMVLVAALAITLAPWTLRNYHVTGHFIATTLWVGPSLYDGLSADATGDSDMQFVERDGLYANPVVPDFEYTADRHYRKLAFDFVKGHPSRAIGLAFTKLGRFLNPFPNAAQFASRATYWSVGLFEAPVLLLAAIGLWQSRHASWRLLLAAGPVLYFALVHSVFIGSVRYRLPAEYALLVLTAVGCRSLCTWTHRTR